MFSARHNALFLVLPFLVGLTSTTARAGGPRWVAGASYFSPTALGKPVVWNGGVVNYYTDLGALSATVTQAEANAMVASAATKWSEIPTAAIQINPAGSLAEDVNGTNFYAGPNGLVMPDDVQSSATGTPVGIIYDADGSVIDALEGAGASDPNSCNSSSVITLVDNFSVTGFIAHALMVVNGRCTADLAHVAMVEYELLRGFGRILGLDWSQANDWMFPGNTTPDGLLGWPLLHPVEKLCNSAGNPCLTGTISPRTDDIAAANRLYPVTSAYLWTFPSKLVTAAATVSIRGTISFPDGQGMQGVNVVATPLIAGTDEPDLRYPAAAVSGSLYIGNAGNPITGVLDSSGNPLSRYGTVTVTDEGFYDLSGIPLPPGATEADYQLTFEAINPLYTGTESVGPYTLGQVMPSGALPAVILRGRTAGSAVVQNEMFAGAGIDANSGGDGTDGDPVGVPVTGQWMARLNGYGHSSWLQWRVRGGRQLTVEAQPVDEEGRETAGKARILTGVWNGDDAIGTPPDVGTPQPFNAVPPGLTTLSFESGNDGDIRIALADQRGDGRPDYLYHGRVLYADSVTPQRVGIAGGPIVIDGVGFTAGNVVTVGGVAAEITSLTPMEITAIAPASPGGATGNVDVTVTDTVTAGWATIEGSSATGLSYDAGSADQLRTLTAPVNAVSIGVPLPFTVQAFAVNGTTPAAGISVTYTVTQGEAGLGCGHASCTVTTLGDGTASLAVTATNATMALVTASLSNGSSVLTTFIGAAPPEIAAVGGTLYLAAGSVFDWTPRALVLSQGLPYPGQTVDWSGGAETAVSAIATISDLSGIAWTQVTVGPLLISAATSVTACLAGAALNGPGCTGFNIAGADPSFAALTGVSGISQILGPGDTLVPVIVQTTDLAGHPIAGQVVTFYETLSQWTPPCADSGSCPAAPALQRLTVQAVSSVAGMVSLSPLTDGIVPTQLTVLAVTGKSATLMISVERHP